MFPFLQFPQVRQVLERPEMGFCHLLVCGEGKKGLGTGWISMQVETKTHTSA